jgi:hypothetical protein
MAWSQTDTAIKAGNKEHLGRPGNFSVTAGIRDLEVEQWNACRQAAQEIMQRKVVGHTGSYTVTLSGTSSSGHAPAGDTVTVTVTSA